MIRSFLSSVRGLLAAGALVLSVAPMSASAGVVYQSITNLNNTSQTTSAWCSTCSWGNYRVYDQFTLGQDSSISGFSVNVYNESSYWGHGLNFSVWSIGTDQLPGQQLFSQTLAASSFSSVNRGSYVTTATTNSLLGLSLTAGSYYVSFYSPATLGVWGYTNAGGKLYQQGAGVYQGQSVGFALNGQAVNNASRNVPEPATLALVGLALAGIGFARRRKA